MAQTQGQTMAPTAAPPPVPGPYQNQSDDEDEWFNQPITRRPVASTATKKPANDDEDDIYEDSFANSWDHQPESGPLIVPSVVVSPNSPSTSTAELPHAFDAVMAISQPNPAPGTTSIVGNDVPLPAKTAPPLVPTDLPPGYSPPPEGSSLGRSMTDTSETSLPPYETATTASSTSPKTAPGFHPTRVLQIETAGIGMIRIPVLPPRADPVPIRVVSETGELGDAVYSSVQASRTSGSCVLVNATTGAPVCTTTYAPGPVRPPKLRLILNSSDKVITPKEASSVLKIKPPFDAEIIPVTGDTAASRACSIRTSLGHFRWRYGNRAEKEDAKGPIMIFERIREKTLPNGKKQETRKRIGHLLRKEDLRTKGSGRMAAGNGGRLMLDFNEWADQKGDSQMLEILAVASCLVMLRKEMNQRRLRQVAVMATTVAIL